MWFLNTTKVSYAVLFIKMKMWWWKDSKIWFKRFLSYLKMNSLNISTLLQAATLEICYMINAISCTRWQVRLKPHSLLKSCYSIVLIVKSLTWDFSSLTLTKEMLSLVWATGFACTKLSKMILNSHYYWNSWSNGDNTKRLVIFYTLKFSIRYC